MTARFFNPPRFAFFDEATGDPGEGWKVYFYAAGTLTLKTIYTTYDRSVEAANPVVLDARGEGVAVLGSGFYNVAVKDADDVTVWTEDDISLDNPAPAFEGDTLDILLDTNADGSAEKVRIYKNGATVGAATLMATLGDVLQTTGGLGLHGVTAPAQAAHIADPASVTTATVLTYSANDPATAPNAAVTIADGTALVAAEVFEVFDEFEENIKDLKADVDAIIANQILIIAILEGVGLKATS